MYKTRIRSPDTPPPFSSELILSFFQTWETGGGA
jgi:hypothetical protein